MPLMRQRYIRTFITSNNNQLPSGSINNHNPDNCPTKPNPLLNKKKSKLSSSHNLLMRKSLLTHKITKPDIVDEKHNSYERYLNRKKGKNFDCQC
tara:strand:- start:918 stop:1202 length:285 start_codon:yes stop_codon:yes gene_type:complete